MEEIKNKTSAVSSDDIDRKKMQKAALIKMLAMIVLVAVIIIFHSIAWFTSSREVGCKDMQMTAAYNGFDLQVSGEGEIGFSSLYPYLEDELGGNTDTITNNNENGQFICWRMADGDDKLRPGSEGVLEFTVIPKGADISKLHYSIDLRTFTEKTEVKEEEKDGKTVQTQTITGLNEITSTKGSDEEKKGYRFLNHHILFFKNRTGDAESGYQYSGFISDPSDFKLTLDEGKATIYWVWVNTFGQIALTSSDTSYIKSNLPYLDTEGEANDRLSITNYLKNNAEYIFNRNKNFTGLITSLYEKRSSDQSYIDEYEALSDGYNSADQTIGAFLDYALIQLTANTGS